MRMPWRGVAAAAAGLLVATLACAQAADASEAAVAEACRLLRGEAEVRAHFPRAVDLCTPSFPAQQTCAARPVATCTSDALCAVRTTFSCARSPCPPGGPTISSCAAGPLAQLAPSIAAYLPCVRSGGAWVPYPGASRNQPWRGTCSCMGPSAAAIWFTRTGNPDAGPPNGYPDTRLASPLRYFVQGRGCVAEDALCREYGGRWVVKVPSAPFERPRCEIDGQAVVWRYKLRVGIGD